MPSQSRIQDMRAAAYCYPAGDAGHENRKLTYLSPSRDVICMLHESRRTRTTSWCDESLNPGLAASQGTLKCRRC